MQKYKISRIGQEKDISTKFGMKKKTGVLFEETGDVWHDIWKGKDLMKIGDELEGTRESKEYEGKVYWTLKLPKKDDVIAGQVKQQGDKLETILNKLTQMNLILQSMRDHVIPKRITQGTGGTETQNTPKYEDGLEYPNNDLGEDQF
jgi:hypothetical protein